MDMHVGIVFNTNTLAFTEGASQEVARILRELAGRLDGHPHFSPGHEQALYDALGLEVGFCGVYEGTRPL